MFLALFPAKFKLKFWPRFLDFNLTNIIKNKQSFISNKFHNEQPLLYK